MSAAAPMRMLGATVAAAVLNVPLRAGLSLRASLAAGLAYSSSRGNNPDPATASAMPTVTGTAWQPAGEGAVTLGYDVSARVGIAIGSVLYYSKFDPSFIGLATIGLATSGVQDDLQVMAYGGARFRL